MFIHTACSFDRRWFGRAGRFACAALMLLSAVNSESAAGGPPSPGHGAFPHAAVENRVDHVPVSAGDRDFPIGAATFSVTTSSHAGSIAIPDADAPAGELPQRPVGDDERLPDWYGIWRDTGMLFGSQIVAAGIIYTMPESVSSWSSEQKRNTFKKFADNVFDPVFDKDKLYINYLLHPYWGATYYIRGRERGLDKVPALVYSTLMSAMYEFGVECFFEKPSIQDLIVTPVAGTLLGAILFEPWRESIKGKSELRWYDHAALVVTDPLGVLSLGIEKIFGISSTTMVDLSIPQFQNRAAGPATVSKNIRIGVVLQFPFI